MAKKRFRKTPGKAELKKGDTKRITGQKTPLFLVFRNVSIFSSNFSSKKMDSEPYTDEICAENAKTQERPQMHKNDLIKLTYCIQSLARIKKPTEIVRMPFLRRRIFVSPCVLVCKMHANIWGTRCTKEKEV